MPPSERAPIDLPLRCRCGAFRAVAVGFGPLEVSRAVCHCRYCIAYAKHMNFADEILDAHGGCDVVLFSPARFVITSGKDHLSCSRLTEKGPLRWHAGCCGTPLANTLQTSAVPFMAVPHGACVDRERTPDYLKFVGPVHARVNGHFPSEVASQLKATKTALLRLLLRHAWQLLRWKFSGACERWPFFDSRTRHPLAHAPVTRLISRE